MKLYILGVLVILNLVNSYSLDKLEILSGIEEQNNTASIKPRNEEGMTPLMSACLFDDAEKVEHFLSSGASLEERSDKGLTALQYALYGKRESKTAKLLIARGANIHVVDNDGRSVLYYSVMNDNIDATKILLEKGVGINEEVYSPYGVKALMISKSPEMSRLLISKGACIKLTDSGGWTALLYAIDEGVPEIVELLIDWGANVNDSTKDGVSALMLAGVKGDLNSLSYLISHGANVSARVKSGKYKNMSVLRYVKEHLPESDKNYKEIINLLSLSGGKK